MSLWVRSQSKKMLIETKSIYIDNNDNKNILCDGSTNTTIVIGVYSSYERALKVLDMIVNYINSGGRMFVTDLHKTDFGMSAIYEKKLGVFQMPRDDEVEDDGN